MRRELRVNGLLVAAEFADADVDGVLASLLRRIAAVCVERTGDVGAPARTVVLLAAPPGAGKSTLAALLEELSCAVEGAAPLQSVGMDGFHFCNAYLDAHGLRSVKGAPETFDARAFVEKIAETRRSTGEVRWPAYSRVAHDVVPDALEMAGEVVLVEGNYLLLDEPCWRDLRPLADLTVFLRADEGLLRERLVARKVAGGMSRVDAEDFYEASDGPNVQRVLTGSIPADVTLSLSADGRLRLT